MYRCHRMKCILKLNKCTQTENQLFLCWRSKAAQRAAKPGVNSRCNFSNFQVSNLRSIQIVANRNNEKSIFELITSELRTVMHTHLQKYTNWRLSLWMNCLTIPSRNETIVRRGAHSRRRKFNSISNMRTIMTYDDILYISLLALAP